MFTAGKLTLDKCINGPILKQPPPKHPSQRPSHERGQGRSGTLVSCVLCLVDYYAKLCTRLSVTRQGHVLFQNVQDEAPG